MMNSIFNYQTLLTPETTTNHGSYLMSVKKFTNIPENKRLASGANESLAGTADNG